MVKKFDRSKQIMTQHSVECSEPEGGDKNKIKEARVDYKNSLLRGLNLISDKGISTIDFDSFRIAHFRNEANKRSLIEIRIHEVFDDCRSGNFIILSENEFRAFLKLQKEVLSSIEGSSEDDPEIFDYMR